MANISTQAVLGVLVIAIIILMLQKALAPKPEHKRRIFVDLDGVLAEFRKGKTFADLYEKGYFETLEPQMPAVNAFRKLMETEDIYVLSCYLSDSEYALAEKKRWVKKYLPGAQCIFVPCGIQKADAILERTGIAVNSNDILIDDHSPNVIDWDEKGGTAIKYLNGINGSGQKWKGRCVVGDFSENLF